MGAKKKRILIAGAGAVGGYFGAKLALGGHHVTFLARGEHLDAGRKHGLKIDSIFGDSVVAGSEWVAAAPAAPQDYIIVATKSYQTAAVIASIGPSVGPGTCIASLQNGLGNEEHLASEFGDDRIIGGVSFIGAERVGPGHIKHTAAGYLTFGEWSQPANEAARDLVSIFKAAGVRARHDTSIRSAIWHKVMWNASYNMATALSLTGTLALSQLPMGRTLLLDSMAEVRLVARAEGVSLPEGAEHDYLEATDEEGDFRTSMLVDRENNRWLEIESISGEIIRRAERFGIDVPVQRTMYALLSAWQSQQRN